MQEYNLIGDIAGEYDTLLALVDKMPDVPTIFVGDMVDRGPKSAQVLQLLLDRPEKFKAVLGNHDHMMLSYISRSGYYPSDVWGWNGGEATLRSYRDLGYNILSRDKRTKGYKKQQELIKLLAGLPLYIQTEDGLHVSHSFPNPSMPLPVACDLERWGRNYHQVEMSIIWNRGQPRRMKGFFQVTGHNSHWGLKTFSDLEGPFGMCIDTSRSSCLTGLHWPSMQIYQQEYIDETGTPKGTVR